MPWVGPVRGGEEAVSGRGHSGGGAGLRASRPGLGAGPRAVLVHCRRRARASWQAAGPQWRGVPAARRAEGHGRLSWPRRRWRRRSSAGLRPVGLRLRLGTRDQNSLGGADSAPAGFSGKVAPGAAPRLPPAAARDGGGRAHSQGRAGPGERQPMPDIPHPDSGVGVGWPVWGLA